MSEVERKLIIEFLKCASDLLSLRRCNDFDLCDYMTEAEAIGFNRRMHEWNGDPEEFCPEDKGFTSDWFVASYLAAKLDGKAK